MNVLIDLIGKYWESVLASCAIVLTIYELHSSRRHNRLSLQPHVALSKLWKGNVYTVNICNNGVGPAVVVHYATSLDNVSKNLNELVQIALSDCGSNNIKSQTAQIEPVYFLLAGKEHEVLRLEFEDGFRRNDVIERLSKVHVKIKYKSLYEVKDEVNECF